MTLNLRANSIYKAAYAFLFVASAFTGVADAQSVTRDARSASKGSLESSFDQAFGAENTASKPKPVLQPAPVKLLEAKPPIFVPVQLPPQAVARPYDGSFESQLAQLTNAEQGRIGVAAFDLTTGQSIAVLGDQPFPMASTSKIAIAATFLDLVDSGRFKLSDEFPLMVPVPSRKFDGPVAPVRPGTMLSAQGLIDLALTHSDNQATDALLSAVGGPAAVNDWMRRSRLDGLRLDRDIATLVRDDGEVNPAVMIDQRDSATPRAMVRLLSGLYQGRFLSTKSRTFLLDTMARCETGKRRIPQLMPEGLVIAHKTGTLSNTASDVGIITSPDGHAFAIAIYVTGQGSKQNREARIAGIARTIYDNYRYNSQTYRRVSAR